MTAVVVASIIVNALLLTGIATIIGVLIGQYIFGIDPSGPGDVMLVLAIVMFFVSVLMLVRMWWYAQGNVTGIPLIDEANIQVAEQYRSWFT